MPVTIGVLGDSHANLDLLRSAAALLRDRHGAEWLIHLGDYYRDAMVLRREGFRVWCVPGLQCPAYGSPERILRESVEGLRIVAAHTPDDLAPQAEDCEIALHGHTHVPYMELRGQTLWLNPGHCKSALDRGHRPSVAVLRVEPGLVQAGIHGLEGELVASEVFRLPGAERHA